MVRGRNWSGGPDVARHKWSLCAIDGPGMHTVYREASLA